MADERSDAALRGRDLIGLGGLLVGSVVVFTVLGLLLDNAFDTTPVFTLMGVGLGIVGAGVGFWIRVRLAVLTAGTVAVDCRPAAGCSRAAVCTGNSPTARTAAAAGCRPGLPTPPAIRSRALRGLWCVVGVDESSPRRPSYPLS